MLSNITQVNVSNKQGNTLELPLEDYSSGYLVKDIQGLEPVKATFVTSSVANVDGVQSQSSRREARYIIMKLGLQTGGRSVQDLRSQLYEYFMTKLSVDMRFVLENGVVAYISGKVEDFICPIFVKEPEATITIMCENPDFYLPDSGSLNGLTTSSYDVETLIEYSGSVDTGISFLITPDRDISGFSIHHRSAETDMLSSLDYELPIAAGERLYISTVPGSKQALIIRTDNTYEEILYGISSYSSWIALTPGKNYIRVHTEGDAIPYLIEYRKLLGGL